MKFITPCQPQKSLSGGVPTGYSPLLFLLYINDQSNCLRSSQARIPLSRNYKGQLGMETSKRHYKFDSVKLANTIATYVYIVNTLFQESTLYCTLIAKRKTRTSALKS